MNHTPVTSSNIKSVAHDGTDVLEVTVRSGQTHRYHGVSPERHQALLKAESVGRHFHEYIRGKYPSEKM